MENKSGIGVSNIGFSWIGESGHIEKDEEIVMVNSWEDRWTPLKDDYNSCLALLPLHRDIGKQIILSATSEYARSVPEKLYACHRILSGWFVTVADNLVTSDVSK